MTYYRTVQQFLLIIFGLLAFFYSVTTPIWESPDEDGHYYYVLHLRQNGSLPVMGKSQSLQAYHPPLYYLFAALFTLPMDVTDVTKQPDWNFYFMYHGQGNDINLVSHRSDETFPYYGYALFLHLARLASVFMGIGTLWLTLMIGRELFPDNPAVVTLAAFLVAFNPQFLFISGVIINDNLITLAATGMLWQFLRTIRHPGIARGWAFVGGWVAVATLAKVSGLILLSLPMLGIVLFALKGRSVHLLIKNLIFLVIPVLLGTGWWFVRNWNIYSDPLGWKQFLKISACCLRTTPITSYDIVQFILIQFKSFWAGFGWMNLWAPDWFYQAIALFYIVGLAGFSIFLFRNYNKLTSFQKLAILSLGFVVFIFEAYMLWAIRRFNASWYQGRNIFPVIAPLMFLLALGACQLVINRFRAGFVGSTGVILFICALYMPVRVIIPAYPKVPLPQWKLYFLPHKTDFEFGDSIVLRGYQITTNGSTATVDLYWQAKHRIDFDYTVFVHMLDEDQNIVTQLDQVPGEAQNFPPAIWHSGDIILDRHQLNLPDSVQEQDLFFRVGMYNWQTGERLPLSNGNIPDSNYVVLSAIE